MNIKLNFLSVLAITFLLISQVAHADFRKALDAFVAKDGGTMLKEVKDAVDKESDDGIILFLGILKAYPNTWRSMLNEVEQAELFDSLETATSKSSLQAQFKLAIIPRVDNNLPPPKSIGKDLSPWYEARKLARLKESREQVARLEPVANKGYAPAAFQLYANYAHQLTKSESDQDNAILWLSIAAQLGDPQAAFFLGMKYLNVVDEVFGCFTRGQSKQPICQLPKDEIKGWYWMQEAAKHANEPGMTLETVLPYELSLQMGDLYMQGVAGNAPDYEQAYLWYRRLPLGWTYDTSEVFEKLEALKKLGVLQQLNPPLDKAWGNATTWKTVADSQEVMNAFKNSPHKLPKLLEQKITNTKPQPVFSMSTVRWFRPNLTHIGIDLEVYDDGQVKLLLGDSSFNESNGELWMRIKPQQIRKFFDEFQHLNFTQYHPQGYCESGCLETLDSSISVKGRQIILKNISYDGYSGLGNPDIKQVLELVEKYFPLTTLTCDADIDEGKRACYQIYKEVLPVNSMEKVQRIE